MSLPNSVNALLTEAECAQIDQTLLPTRDRFAIRLKIYAARYLKTVSRNLQIPIKSLTSEQISDYLKTDESMLQEDGLEESFQAWFGDLLVSSIRSLDIVAHDLGYEIEDLSLSQIIDWQHLHLKLEERNGASGETSKN